MPKLKAHDKAIRDAWDDFNQELRRILIAADGTATTKFSPEQELEKDRRVHKAMLDAAKQVAADINGFASYAELEAAIQKADEELDAMIEASMPQAS